MVRPGNLRKVFEEENENTAARRFPNMVKNFGTAKNLFDFQKKRAIYANRKVSNYVNAMRNARPMLYKRLENKVAGLPTNISARGKNILSSVTANSSPKELFNAMKAVNALRPTRVVPVTREPLNKLKYTQTYMAEELGKSRNRKNYANKVFLFSNQDDYARAVIRAKVILAKRVKMRYDTLSEVNKRLVNISGLNKSSNPERLLRALERMATFNRAPNTNMSWRFN
jgi:hypothetical protein